MADPRFLARASTLAPAAGEIMQMLMAQPRAPPPGRPKAPQPDDAAAAPARARPHLRSARDAEVAGWDEAEPSELAELAAVEIDAEPERQVRVH